MEHVQQLISGALGKLGDTQRLAFVAMLQSLISNVTAEAVTAPPADVVPPTSSATGPSLPPPRGEPTDAGAAHLGDLSVDKALDQAVIDRTHDTLNDSIASMLSAITPRQTTRALARQLQSFMDMAGNMLDQPTPRARSMSYYSVDSNDDTIYGEDDFDKDDDDDDDDEADLDETVVVQPQRAGVALPYNEEYVRPPRPHRTLASARSSAVDLDVTVVPEAMCGENSVAQSEDEGETKHTVLDVYIGRNLGSLGVTLAGPITNGVDCGVFVTHVSEDTRGNAHLLHERDHIIGVCEFVKPRSINVTDSLRAGERAQCMQPGQSHRACHDPAASAGRQ